MTAQLVRVINSQKDKVKRSILLDKIDRSQGNFTFYAQRAKQKLYVPYVNPLDPTVPGYVDLVPTDEVLLQTTLPKGVIAQLQAAGWVTFSSHTGASIATPTVTAASHNAAAPIGGQTGVVATTTSAVSGVATITGLTGMTAASVGHYLIVSNGAVAGNNATSKIVAYHSAVSVDIANPAADGSGSETNNGSLHWTEEVAAHVAITGTTFVSLAPDITYITLTNLSSVTQKISSTALALAGLPNNVAATSIFIDNALVTIGTPAAGWLVTVQANSKVSNQFTLT